MKPGRHDRVATIVWLSLIAATLLSWRIGIFSNADNFPGVKLEGIALILIALIKIRCVLLYFMQLKTAPLAWRLVFESWLLIVGVAMIVIFDTTAAAPGVRPISPASSYNSTHP